jgi:xylose isomerase
MTQWEKFAKGHVPPIDALALDWDAAWTIWEAYPEFRHRLRRNLAPFHEEMFQKILSGKIKMLTREQCRQAATLTDLEKMDRDRATQVRRKIERYSTMW